ncbi:MAG TPA: hypothetical protein VM143_10625 [Acidimicrobiales bacterium]|nr:hypothetical protein [Acidimicrobiales bacterium]
MATGRRWARGLPAIDVEIDCAGARHRVLLRRGKVVLEDHSIAAEAAAVALGAPAPACFEVYRSWRLREQWEIALQPRGPGFHQLYRRPPLPRQLVDPLERGIVRGWERRAARGEGLAAYVLQRGVRAKAEPAMAAAFDAAVRALGGGPTKRLELALGSSPWVSGTITPTESSLLVRVTPDWLRRVGLPRLATASHDVGLRAFVVAVVPRRLVVAWRPAGEQRWTAHLAADDA